MTKSDLKEIIERETEALKKLELPLRGLMDEYRTRLHDREMMKIRMEKLK